MIPLANSSHLELACHDAGSPGFHPGESWRAPVLVRVDGAQATRYRSAPPKQEPPGVFPLHGPEHDDEVDESTLLFASEGYLWAEDCGDAKLGAEVLLESSSRVVTNGGVVLVAERVETSAAGRFVLDLVETMEIIFRPYRADKTPPRIAVEARERDVGQESPRVSERDLRHRNDLGEETLAADRRAGEASRWTQRSGARPYIAPRLVDAIPKTLRSLPRCCDL